MTFMHAVMDGTLMWVLFKVDNLWKGSYVQTYQSLQTYFCDDVINAGMDCAERIAEVVTQATPDHLLVRGKSPDRRIEDYMRRNSWEITWMVQKRLCT